jgi:hypothetical protein
MEKVKLSSLKSSDFAKWQQKLWPLLVLCPMSQEFTALQELMWWRQSWLALQAGKFGALHKPDLPTQLLYLLDLLSAVFQTYELHTKRCSVRACCFHLYCTICALRNLVLLERKSIVYTNKLYAQTALACRAVYSCAVPQSCQQQTNKQKGETSYLHSEASKASAPQWLWAGHFFEAGEYTEFQYLVWNALLQKTTENLLFSLSRALEAEKPHCFHPLPHRVLRMNR